MILTTGTSTWRTWTSATARRGSRFTLLLLLHLRPWPFLHPQPKRCDPRPTEEVSHGLRAREGSALHASLQASLAITCLLGLSPPLCILQIPALLFCRRLRRVPLFSPPSALFPGPSSHRDRGRPQDPPFRLVASLRQCPQRHPLPRPCAPPP